MTDEAGSVNTTPPLVLVFDSGAGGLTVVRALRAHMPHAGLVYLADTALFPYGALVPDELVARVETLIGEAIGKVRPDAVLIACNSASTLVLDPLRARFTVPFIGTVPAIKPAAEATKSGIIGVLATEGTIARDYTRQLIDDFAHDVEVLLHAPVSLAAIAEAKLAGEPVSIDAIGEAILPVFVERDGARTDMVVLACTHFPLLLDELIKAAPWPVTFIDPAEAIARRVGDVVGPGHAADRAIAAGTVLTTAPLDEASPLADAYRRFGFSRFGVFA